MTAPFRSQHAIPHASTPARRHRQWETVVRFGDLNLININDILLQLKQSLIDTAVLV